jgi:hypothetical protein
MEEVENDYVRYWFENGILMNELKRPTHITLDIMKELIELRHQFSNHKHQYWCMDSGRIKSVNREAMVYAEKYGQDYIYANGIIVNSHLAMTFYNVFMILKNSKIPFKFFTKREKAIKWLMEMKAKNGQV